MNVPFCRSRLSSPSRRGAVCRGGCEEPCAEGPCEISYTQPLRRSACAAIACQVQRRGDQTPSRGCRVPQTPAALPGGGRWRPCGWWPMAPILGVAVNRVISTNGAAPAPTPTCSVLEFLTSGLRFVVGAKVAPDFCRRLRRQGAER